MLEGAKNLDGPGIAELRPDRLAASNAIDAPNQIGNRHTIAMRKVSRRFWALLGLIVAASIIGWAAAKALLNEPLLAAVGLS